MILYKRTKRNPDRTVRCYLTLRCSLSCSFCSAGVPSIREDVKSVVTPPEVWAEGMNKRKRYSILAGGEPFEYPGFSRLISLIEPGYKVEIYSNLWCDSRKIDDFIKSANQKYSVLISLHPGVTNFDVWSNNVLKIQYAGHSVRFHIVKTGNYELLTELLRTKGLNKLGKVTLCGDQNSGVKSTFASRIGEVACSSRIYLFGPDGFRYPCLKLMGVESNQAEHISDGDPDTDWLVTNPCYYFGTCTGCDNNIEGTVETIDVT